MPGLTSRIRSSNSGIACDRSLSSSGRSGRGPTMLILPRSTSQNCGSSSSRDLRRNLPTRVTRGSFAPATTTPVFASASTDIVRNLCIVNSSNWSRRTPVLVLDLAQAAGAALRVEDRPRRVEVDRRGDDRHERRGHARPTAAPSTSIARLAMRTLRARRTLSTAVSVPRGGPGAIRRAMPAPIRLIVPGPLRYRAIAVRVVAEAGTARIVQQDRQSE